jgi:dihydrolipoamide dehydrogenase
VDSHTILVEREDEENVSVTAEHVILATGSRSARLPGLTLQSPRLMNSTRALELEDIPKTLLVVGGGYIGLELGTVYASLGSQVSVVEMMPGLLPGADRDLIAVLARRLKSKFHSIMLETKVVDMKEEQGGIRVRFEGKDTEGSEQVFEKILVSVGRWPNSDIPGLENTSVELDERRFIKVDAQRRTTDPAVFAIGDVAGEPMLAHKASHEARVAVETIAGHDVAFEPRAIPAVVFTDPEVAWCGLTETEARSEKRSVKTARFPWGASGRATTLGRSDGFTKLLIDPESEQVLGAAIVGPGAGELISEAALAIEMGASASDVKLTIHPHPTLSETVMEAAEAYFGHATHIFRPGKAK